MTRAEDITKQLKFLDLEAQKQEDILEGEIRMTATVQSLAEIFQNLKAKLWNYTPKEKRELLLRVVKKITMDCYTANRKHWRTVKKNERGTWDRDDWQIHIEFVFNPKELRSYFQLPLESLRYSPR